MRHKLSIGDAEKIAILDYKYGISSAIEGLEKLGFDCRYYWDTMSAYIDGIDTDDANIKTRDKLFKKLRIYKTMQKAYNNIWGVNYGNKNYYSVLR